ncbi:MAG: N-acetyltransferase [Pseudomonadota bacterium]
MAAHSNITISAPSVEHRSEILRVVTDAFDQKLEAELVDRFWADNSIIVETIASVDDKPVGYAAISPVTVSHTDGTVTAAMGLAPVAVSPPLQRQHIGTRMVESLLDDAFQCFPDQAVFVLGDAGYYARFGFHSVESRGYRWEGGKVGQAFQARLRNGSPPPTLSSSDDNEIEAPATIHYCDAFRVFDGETA